MKFIIRASLLSILLFVHDSVQAQTPDTLRVLFAGNSYTYYFDLPGLVSLISEGTETKLVTEGSLTGGVSLKDHWNGARGLRTKSMIESGSFDIVVLQEQSLGTIRQADAFHLNAEKLCTLIKQSGATPYFYVTWSRENRQEDQEIITEEYRKAASNNHAELVLVGEAWKIARDDNPNIKLYHSDGSHPTKVGTLLAACIFTQTITGELPQKLRNQFQIFNIREDRKQTLIFTNEEIEFVLGTVRRLISDQ